MNISRNFLMMGSLHLLVGVLIGMYMGGTGNHDFVPLHAHVNLLGFALMSVFAFACKPFPALAGSKLATIHFRLHQTGALVLVVMLFLLLSGNISEAGMAPVAPLAEAAVLIGVAVFAFNVFRNAK